MQASYKTINESKDQLYDVKMRSGKNPNMKKQQGNVFEAQSKGLLAPFDDLNAPNFNLINFSTF